MNKQIEYGFAELKLGDEVFSLVPSFFNISKIGTPKEIVQCFTTLALADKIFISSFNCAANILQCCGLPEELTGGLAFSNHKEKFLIRPGKLPIEHVFLLANHCLMHGVVGVIEIDDEDKDKTGDTLTEFDVHRYIVDAVEFLGMSYNEAQDITMTQFVKLVKAKNKNAKERNPELVSEKERAREAKAAEEWYNKKSKEINKNKPDVIDPNLFFKENGEKANRKKGLK